MITNNSPQKFDETKELIGTVIVILIAIVLFATNPSELQFKNYLKESYKKEGAVMELFSGPASFIAGLSTKRKNYYLFSSYTITILGVERVYVGILNNFIEL